MNHYILYIITPSSMLRQTPSNDISKAQSHLVPLSHQYPGTIIQIHYIVRPQRLIPPDNGPRPINSKRTRLLPLAPHHRRSTLLLIVVITNTLGRSTRLLDALLLNLASHLFAQPALLL